MILSVIIINYNTKGLLRDCLISILFHHKETNFEIIVIDNGFPDGSLEMIKVGFPMVRLIANKENLGFARANNQGAKVAKGEILFFLNPDTLIKENIFQKIIEAFQQDTKIGIVAPQLILSDGSAQPWAYGQEQSLWQLIKSKLGKQAVSNIDWVSGAALAIRREIFEKVGGFDEKIFMYFEDRDLCRRVRDSSYKIVILPDTRIIHFGGKSLTRDKQRKKLYYQSQNYYWQKHYGDFRALLMRFIRWPYKFYIFYFQE